MQFLDMPVTFRRSALAGSLLLWVVTLILALLFTELTPLDAFIVGLLATILHWVAVLVHHYGHFIAARRIGHPMQETRPYWVLSQSRYPQNEAPLLPQQHMRRAIGGPIASAIWLVILLVLLALLWPLGGLMRFLVAWQGVIAGLAVVLPLIPIETNNVQTDGHVLLVNWRKLRRSIQ